jgi:hypothetical protein
MTLELTTRQAEFLFSLLADAIESLEDAQQTSPDNWEISAELEAANEIINQLKL